MSVGATIPYPIGLRQIALGAPATARRSSIVRWCLGLSPSLPSLTGSAPTPDRRRTGRPRTRPCRWPSVDGRGGRRSVRRPAAGRQPRLLGDHDLPSSTAWNVSALFARFRSGPLRCAMFPGSPRRDPWRRPSGHLGADWFSHHLRRARRRRQSASRLLRSLGVEPAGHVALCLENHPRYVELLWAATTPGACTPPPRRPDERRVGLHRRRLRRHRLRHVAAPRRPGRSDRAETWGSRHGSCSTAM